MNIQTIFLVYHFVMYSWKLICVFVYFHGRKLPPHDYFCLKVLCPVGMHLILTSLSPVLPLWRLDFILQTLKLPLPHFPAVFTPHLSRLWPHSPSFCTACLFPGYGHTPHLCPGYCHTARLCPRYRHSFPSCCCSYHPPSPA